MKLAAIAFIVAGLGRIAVADPGPCHARAPLAKITASFRPGVSLAELSVWITGITCKNVVFSDPVASHAMRLNVIAPNELTPKQALALYVDAIEATGLVVTQKADTLIVKLGPGMPQACPDVAAVSVPPDAGEEGGVVGGVVGGPSDGDDLEAQLDRGTQRIDATHVVITRELVDKMLANPMSAAKSARIVPAVMNGKPSGFKLYAIRPRSIYARLGLENGDTLVSINGLDLSSPDRALEVYAKLRDATSLELAIVRRGKPLVLHITIR